MRLHTPGRLPEAALAPEEGARVRGRATGLARAVVPAARPGGHGLARLFHASSAGFGFPAAVNRPPVARLGPNAGCFTS